MKADLMDLVNDEVKQFFESFRTLCNDLKVSGIRAIYFGKYSTNKGFKFDLVFSLWFYINRFKMSDMKNGEIKL